MSGDIPAPTSQNAVDPSVMIALFGVEDRDMFRSVMVSFIEKTPPDLERLLAALKSGDTAETGSIAHKIKSAARTIGAADMAALCEFVEKQGKAGQVNNPGQLAQELSTRFASVEAFVRAY